MASRQDRLLGLHRDRVYAAIEIDLRRVRRPARSDGGTRGRRLEFRQNKTLDENSLIGHRFRGQRLLHHIHKRTGATNVKIRARGRGHNGPGRGKVEKPIGVVQAMHQLEATGVLRLKRSQLGAKNNRILIAIRIEQVQGTLSRGQRTLQDRDHRSNAAASAEKNQRSLPRLETEMARGFHHMQGLSRRHGIVEPVGDSPVFHPLDGDLVLGFGVGTTCQGIAAHPLVPL